jgi:hypothetical protein
MAVSARNQKLGLLVARLRLQGIARRSMGHVAQHGVDRAAMPR